MLRENLSDTMHKVRSGASRSEPSEMMRKRSVVIAGHRTSVSLETAFWEALKQIADHQALSVNRLVEVIDAARTTNLSSAIRVHVLKSCTDHAGLNRDRN